MKDKQYSWHGEFYDKALKQMAAAAASLFPSSEFGTDTAEGWLEWFEETYPEKYKKYSQAISHIVDLWGNKDPQAMEMFKKAVKVEADATKWALEHFKAHGEELRKGAEMKGTQEILV